MSLVDLKRCILECWCIYAGWGFGRCVILVRKGEGIVKSGFDQQPFYSC